MLKKEWQRTVDWGIALGKTPEQAIRDADKRMENDREVQEATNRRFNEYGTPIHD